MKSSYLKIRILHLMMLVCLAALVLFADAKGKGGNKKKGGGGGPPQEDQNP